ncbi:hypothetical protein H0H93_009900 [Arthromyces matolae]|nr:hypothetical protein H0H93_009900 [Arthromyces matolae]
MRTDLYITLSSSKTNFPPLSSLPPPSNPLLPLLVRFPPSILAYMRSKTSGSRSLAAASQTVTVAWIGASAWYSQLWDNILIQCYEPYIDTGMNVHLACTSGGIRCGIFYLEALDIASAILDVALTAMYPKKILLCTDSSNAVAMFSSFHAKPKYNTLLRNVVDCILDGNHELRVVHIPGEENVIADLLSRQKFMELVNLHPNIKIKDFKPPRVLLGAYSK